MIRGTPVKKEKWPMEKLRLASEKRIHEDRAEKDPIYQLLLFPHAPLEVRDDKTQELLYVTTFVDRLLQGIKDMLHKKYGESYATDPLICDMFKTLQADYCGPRLKVFALLFIIKWEPEVTELIRDLYDEEEAPFGGLEQFNHLLRILDGWIAGIKMSAYSQFDIVPRVEHFIDLATLEYVMGPFQ